MWTFIRGNLASILVLLAVALLVGGSVWSLVREKNRGGACGGGCAGCPHAGKCKGH